MSAQAQGSLAPTVVFASDYGLNDPYVGLCHLAVARVGATLGAHVDVVDLSHTLPAYDVRVGAAMLRDALPWIPAGSVVLAVVDPGVGTDRAGVVVRADSSPHPGAAGEGGTSPGRGPGGTAGVGAAAAGSGRAGDAGPGAAPPAGGSAVGPVHLVGPDNGLLTAAVGEHIRWAWRINTAPQPWPAVSEPVAATFDGRDVFAPIAARLAIDADAATGELDPIGVDELVWLRLPPATVTAGWIDAEVVRVDAFGNLVLSAVASAIGEAGFKRGQAVRIHTREGLHHASVARVFAELGEGNVGVLADAFGRLQIVVDRGDAAERLGVGVGARLSVEAG